MQYKTQGIIIKRKKFGEAGRLLTIYTEKKGKIIAIAKGVRRIKSKLAGHLELFYLTDFVIAEGKNLDIITGAQVINNHQYLRDNLQLSNQAYYISEIVDKLVGENESNKKLFDLLKKCLTQIENNNQLLLSYFSMQILGLLGHQPELDICAHCHQKLSELGKHYFSHQFGGIICQNCQQYDNQVQTIDINDIKLLRLLSNSDIKIIDRVKLDSTINNLISQFLEYILEAEIKSKKFL